MKKTFTLIFALLLSVSIFAVKVTLKVDMTGQDVSKGVFVTGDINAWVFTALTDNGSNIWSTTFDLKEGDLWIYYFLRTNSWTGYLDYRETIPTECSNSIQKVGGWLGDRLIVVPATDVIVNHIFSGCLTTASQKVMVDSGFSIFPNPATEKTIMKLNGNTESLSITISDLSGKQIRLFHSNARQGDIELDLTGLNKGVYFVRASDPNKTYVQKLIVR